MAPGWTQFEGQIRSASAYLELVQLSLCFNNDLLTLQKDVGASPRLEVVGEFSCDGSDKLLKLGLPVQMIVSVGFKSTIGS